MGSEAAHHLWLAAKNSPNKGENLIPATLPPVPPPPRPPALFFGLANFLIEFSPWVKELYSKWWGSR